MPVTADLLPLSAAVLWNAYVADRATPPDAPARLYDCMRVGGTGASADAGAKLILAGVKTATSSLEAEYAAGDRPPRAGDLSVVMDGRNRAVCIVETHEVARRRFDEVDAGFARDYGEWDRTLATWQRQCGDYYARLATRLGVEWSGTTVLVCERFRVVFSAPPR